MKMRFIMLLSLCLFVTMSWMNCDSSKKKISKRTKTDSVIVDSVEVKKYLKEHSPENHSKIDPKDIDPGFNQTKN